MTEKEFEEYLKKEVKTIQKLAQEVYPNEVDSTFLTISIDLGSDYYNCWTLDKQINFTNYDEEDD